mmetsp:Transcript_11289/g.37693  ORF Transcript_11289/g.37693 Transcript_11289/m.37693 type:complete len:224 (+) Transcript_11289:795-1466(+)
MQLGPKPGRPSNGSRPCRRPRPWKFEAEQGVRWGRASRSRPASDAKRRRPLKPRGALAMAPRRRERTWPEIERHRPPTTSATSFARVHPTLRPSKKRRRTRPLPKPGATPRCAGRRPQSGATTRGRIPAVQPLRDPRRLRRGLRIRTRCARARRRRPSRRRIPTHPLRGSPPLVQLRAPRRRGRLRSSLSTRPRTARARSRVRRAPPPRRALACGGRHAHFRA